MAPETLFDRPAPFASNGRGPTAHHTRSYLTLTPQEHAHLAAFLDTYLVEQHLRPSDLAERAQISTNYLNAMKSARHLREGKAPTYRLVQRMAQRLGLPLETLMGLPPTPAAQVPEPVGAAEPGTAAAAPTVQEEILTELLELNQQMRTMLQHMAAIAQASTNASETLMRWLAGQSVEAGEEADGP